MLLLVFVIAFAVIVGARAVIAAGAVIVGARAVITAVAIVFEATMFQTSFCVHAHGVVCWSVFNAGKAHS